MREPFCPNCDLTLRPVSARGRGGYLLLLEQCSRCGGLWCDRWELSPADLAKVAGVNAIDRRAIWAPVCDVKRGLSCPRCRKPLQRFQDQLLPEDARIERCRSCDGMWLNRGELRHFKGRRGTYPHPQPLPDGSIRQLTKHYLRATNWPTVTPPDAGENGARSAVREVAEAKGYLAHDTAWTALRLLMRLLFRS